MTDNAQDILKQLELLEKADDFPPLLAAFEGALPAEASARTDALLQAGEILNAKGQYADAQRLLEMALQSAQKLASHSRQALALGLMADIHRAQGNFRSALSKLVEARERLDTTPQQDKEVSARLYIWSGLNNMSLGDYETARQHFYEAYQVYHKLDDHRGIAISSNRLGTIATMNAQYGEAEKYLQESLRIAKELGDRHAMAGALLNLGEIKRLQDNPQEARPLYYESSALFASLGMHRGMCIAENNLGHIHAKMQDFSTAKYHYARAVECAKIADLVPDMLDTLAGLVYIFIARQEYEPAVFCVAYILRHPAHLQETEQFLEPAQQVVSRHAQFQGHLPPSEQLPQVVEEMISKIF
ncbi:MAG: tetratricopeptide repeat protein [Candidatus Latescibacteria bacterium]|nr:tetratricopeptide repeat protein [Candidatus Latescibacterota bacterium]